MDIRYEPEYNFRKRTKVECPNTILSRKGTIISYLALLERLFRTKQTKKEPACSVAEQAGVPIDRVIGGLRERVLIAQAWSMLFHLLSREGIFLLAAEDEDLTVAEEFNRFNRVLRFLYVSRI